MHGDREERRFFAYLNLFVFSMLLLVLAGDFVILLAGWGLVGLSSYLLIGFWWERPAAVAAARCTLHTLHVGGTGVSPVQTRTKPSWPFLGHPQSPNSL